MTIAGRWRAFAGYAPSELCRKLAAESADREQVTGLLAEAAPDQRWPMLLLAAVQLETIRSGEPYPDDGDDLERFCVEHRAALLETIRSRSTQTNEVGRCSFILPALAAAYDGRPLALIEVGASRRLVLNLDRYRYDYSGRAAGDAHSAVRIETELRAGDPSLDVPPIASRVGIDLAPRPDDEWLRACVFADQPERRTRLDAALAIAAEHPPEVIRGDAIELLAGQIAAAPAGSRPVVFHTAVAFYLPAERRARLHEAGAGATQIRGEPVSTTTSDFSICLDGTELARAHPHGAWLEWLG